jgi:dienelactone hydrolase
LAPEKNPQLAFPDRLNRGYTIVLPGIWGEQTVDHGIVTGLMDADVQSAIELYDWTASPLWLVYNLRNLDHNRAEARKIAEKIVRYQERYPGRPVCLIGYSGGGGVAVLTLEALPPEHRVTTAILLAPTLACDYDLRPAISGTERGIHNFYSPLDAPILMVLGTVVGTTDGRHTLAAGAVGFEVPSSVAAAGRRAYMANVVQESYDPAMLLDGHAGGHFGWAGAAFVAHHVAPLLAPPTAPLPPTSRQTLASAHAVRL